MVHGKRVSQRLDFPSIKRRCTAMTRASQAPFDWCKLGTNRERIKVPPVTPASNQLCVMKHTTASLVLVHFFGVVISGTAAPQLASWIMLPPTNKCVFSEENPSVEQQIRNTGGYFSAPTEGPKVTIKRAVASAIPACPPDAFVTNELLSHGRFAATFKAVHKDTGVTVLRKDVLVRVKGMREFDMQLRLSLRTRFVGQVYCVNSRASDHYYHRTTVRPEGWPSTLREGTGIPGSLPMKHKRPLPPDTRPVSIFMEYFGRGDLQHNVSQWQGMLTPLRTLLRTQWLAEIHAAIEKIHKLGYVLFDVKPENIAVASDGHIRVIDFGLSLPYRSGGIILKGARGTGNYRAPEVRGTTDEQGHFSYAPNPLITPSTTTPMVSFYMQCLRAPQASRGT